MGGSCPAPSFPASCAGGWGVTRSSSPTGWGLREAPGLLPAPGSAPSSPGPAPCWRGRTPRRGVGRTCPQGGCGCVCLCLRWQAVLPWVSRGRRPQPCRRHRGNRVSSVGTPPLSSCARPRVTDPASLLPVSPTLSLCRPASPGPGQLPAKGLRPAGPPVTPASVQQVQPGPWRPVSSDVGLLAPCPRGVCALCPRLPAALEPVTHLLTDAWPAAPAPAPSPEASETRVPAWGKKKQFTRLNY